MIEFARAQAAAWKAYNQKDAIEKMVGSLTTNVHQWISMMFQNAPVQEIFAPKRAPTSEEALALWTNIVRTWSDQIVGKADVSADDAACQDKV